MNLEYDKLTQIDKIICVDIDGTILSLETDYYNCVPLPGARESLQAMRDHGYRIHLYTGRHILNTEPTEYVLKTFSIPYDIIIYGKPPAKYYIDDRAVIFRTWDQVMEDIKL